MRKNELKAIDPKWFSVWMLQEAQKRKRMDSFQFQSLRDVLKIEGDRMKEFVTKYCEVKVQTSRKKVTKAMYMESESV